MCMKETITELMKKEMLRRNYSIRTIQSYCFCVKHFLNKCKKEINKISKKDVQNYLDYLIDKGKSGSTANLSLCSIKFMLEEVMHRNMNIRLKFSKRPKTLPCFLTKEEVKALFDATKNEKHKLMLELLYSGGLRVSELIKLKVSDFEFSMNYAWVRKGKGSKDRPFIIAERIKQKLIKFIEQNKLNHDDYLFKGLKNQHISPRTVQEIVKAPSKKAKLAKNVHPHTLRHIFATHLIENGSDVYSVQSLLGHNSSQTTMIYIHMASPKIINVKSPFDSL